MTSASEESELDELLARLFPITRSLSGEGNRQTLEILREIAPITTVEVPSGSKVFDWTIPDEWSIRDAWIKNDKGEKLVDYKRSNLQVVSYSEPVHLRLRFEQLEPHIFYLENRPEAIPYRTSYYNRGWGFGVTKNQYELLRTIGTELEVFVDSSFDSSGSMSIGELFIPGELSDEYIVSTYICHPAMANDNLSGMAVTALLARDFVGKQRPRYSWRFIFVPETIGPLAYFSFREIDWRRIQGGFVVTCCGGPGPIGLKATFLGDHTIDKAMNVSCKDNGVIPVRYPFSPEGSDERQYSSPGFRIPVGTICKDKYYEYPEYHTSDDNLDFVTGQQLGQTLQLYRDAIYILEQNRVVNSLVPFGEAQLGKRGLYSSIGGSNNQPSVGRDKEVEKEDYSKLIAWIMFLADGQHDLIDVARQTKIRFDQVIAVAEQLKKHRLIELR